MNGDFKKVTVAVYQGIGSEGSTPLGGLRYKTGASLALELGYPRAMLDKIPARALEGFVGADCLASTALEIADNGRIPEGFIVDCGCGAGVDSLWLAEAGRSVISIDPSDAMIGRLTDSAIEMGVSGKILPLLAAMPHLPLGPDTTSCVTMNGAANLVEDKRELAGELFRILKSGGVFLAADITSLEPLDETVRNDAYAWAYCIAGALSPDEWSSILAGAGFTGIEVRVTETFLPLGRIAIRAVKP